MYMNELFPVRVARAGSQPLFDPDDSQDEVVRILVCVKRVPAPGARINITADGQAVDTAHLGFTTSPHEECAVEAAVQLVEAHGGEVTVLTLGPAAAEEQLRYAVERRRDERRAARRPTDSDWDPQRTARAITAAVARARGGGRPVRPDPVRQRVGRLRRLPGRRPRRPRPRPADGQRRQGHLDRPTVDVARAARVRRRTRDLRAAAAGGRRRQGRHQPAPLPDHEGPAGVEEGPRSSNDHRRGGAGGSAMVRLQRAGRTGDRRPSSSASGPTPPPPSSTCSSSSGCCDDGRSSSSSTTAARSRRPTFEALTAARASLRNRRHCGGADDRRRRRPARRGARALRRRRRAPGTPRAARRLRARGVGRRRRPSDARLSARRSCSPPAPTAATRCSPRPRPGSTCRSPPTASCSRPGDALRGDPGALGRLAARGGDARRGPRSRSPSPITRSTRRRPIARGGDTDAVRA